MSTLNSPTASAGGSDEPAGLTYELAAVFATFGPAYMKWINAHARDQGLTFPRMKTLHALRCDGPQIMTSLRDRLGVTARSVTALVDALEEDRLVRRVAHPTDRRATIIELTEDGRAMLEGVFEAHSERAAQLFSHLDESDQRELLRLMRRLTATLAAVHA